MDKFLDKSSQLLDKALNFLMLTYPLRTALGILTGYVLSIIAKVFKPAIEKLEILSLDEMNDLHFIIVGVVLLNLPTIFGLLGQKPEFDENTEKAFRIIEKAKASGVPEYRIQQMYSDLCQKVLFSRTSEEPKEDKPLPE